MIIVPDKCIYLFTPRTGSRATERAFLDQVPGAYALDPNVHHDQPDTIPDMGLPVYATIRDPFRQVLSWFWPWRKLHTVADYLDRAPPGRSWIKNRLNVYDEYVDGYFMFEDGLEHIFHALGYGYVSVPEVGVSGVDDRYLDEKARAAVNRVLAFDVDLYWRVASGERRVW